MIGMLLCGFIFICAIYWLFLKTSPIAHIPGPRPLPLIGNVHLLDPEKAHFSIDALSKTYGGVYSFQLFTEPVVVVTDPGCIHELLVEKSRAFAGRPHTYRFDIQSMNQSGLTFTGWGPKLRGRRKLAHSYIKQYGAGMEKIENVTSRWLEGMVRDLTTLEGAATDPADMMMDIALDILVEFLTGKAASIDKDQMRMIETSIYDLGKGLGVYPFGALIDKIPQLRFIPDPTFRKYVAAIAAIEKQVRSWINDDSIAGYVKHVEELTPEDKQKYGVSTLEERISTTTDLVEAGTATTSATMYTLLNVLSQMPEVQNKLRDELLTVVGASRAPSLADKANMPYHRAVILEIGRFGSILPLGVFRVALDDTELKGFVIPKDMQVVFNLWSMHHNAAVFDDPFSFMPERYLDAAGEVIPADHPNRKFTMPFGAGVRVCVGELFALSRLFLIISTLVQKFTIEPEGTVDAQPSMDPRDMQWGLFLMPPSYKVRFVPRETD